MALASRFAGSWRDAGLSESLAIFAVKVHADPMSGATQPGQIRLAELIAALSLGIDLGFGQPMEHVLRQCLIGLRIAERIGLDEHERATVYYTALLINVGCHSDAHEQARWFGDDIEMKSHKYDSVGFSLKGALGMLQRLGAGRPPLQRMGVRLEFVLRGRRNASDMITSHARLARALAQQLRLPQATIEALGAAYEQWDGNGWPGSLAGSAIPVASRIAHLAEYVEVAHRVGGVGAVVELARTRSSRQFDPALAQLLRERAAELLDGIGAVRAWDAVIGAEPALAVVLSEEHFDSALLAIANFIDMKSPFLLGHSPAIAELSAAAGRALGLPPAEVRLLRRSGLVHGFGRLGVSNSILDKPGPLGAGEWERVRMQPYFTERMLHQSPVLAPLGAVAVQHRERLDGKGYPRALSGGAIGRSARILGAAEAYQAMREPRPHRAALAAEEAARQLRAEVRSGRLDGEVAEAVLDAAGHRVRRRPTGPAGLTAREVEVLRLLARGLSTKEIGERLGLSPKTAANHIEHIYSKIEATNRVTASLFALQHGLLPEDELASPPD
jgi:HD-GYP domain-containing protein (c-di-GMP phosphodiesterase class II)